MTAESNERPGDDAVAKVYRDASAALDERPDPRVRAAVLAAAARAVDARPHDAARPRRVTPFGSKRWGWSIAAVLVVSVMTGLVAMNAWRERPDLIEGRKDSQAEIPAIAVAPSVDKVQPGAAPAPETSSVPSRRIATPPAAAPVVPKKAAPRAEPFPKAPDEPARSAVPPPPPAAPAQSDDAQPVDEAPRSHVARAESAPSTAGMLARPRAAAPVARAKTEAADKRDDRDAESPQAWVARIVRLRAAGRDDEADRELVKLHERHPEFTIPREALSPNGTR